MTLDLPAISKRLADIEALIGEHVRTIVGVAVAAPPGGNHAWDRVLTHYGVAQDSPVERLEVAAQAGQARGATLVELERVLVTMAAQARAEIDHIVASVPVVPIGNGASRVPVGVVGAGTHDVEFEGRIATLRAHLDRLPKAESGRYAAAVCPPREAVAASVGSVFANAQATAKLTPWANVKIDPTRVLECRACGAPQEVALDFVCRYCRSPMGKLAK